MMQIADMNWMQVRDHVANDDRAVLPIGSTEQHAYLSLAVDSILSARVAAEAAEPLRIPVFPVIAYGLTPSFIEYRAIRLSAHPDRERARRKYPGSRRSARMAGAQSRLPREMAQLVECAEDLGKGDGNRSRRITCVLARKLSMDAARRRRPAHGPETDAGFRAIHPA
jgi:hypothetical protein